MSKKLSNKEEALLEQVIRTKTRAESSITLLDSEVAENWDYYYGRLPEASSESSSTYVDKLVYSTVEGAVSQIMPIFSSNDKQAVVIQPENHEDYAVAEAKTAYINDKVLEEANGKEALRSAIQEACISRISWLKVTWEEESVPESLLYSGVTTGQLKELKKDNDEVEELRKDKQGNKNIYDVKVINYNTKGKLRITSLPFYSVIFDTGVESSDKIKYVAQRNVYQVGELFDMFDKEIVRSAAPQDASSELVTMEAESFLASTPNATSFDRTDSITSDTSDYLTKDVVLYEHYIRTSALTNGRALQWVQVFTLNDNLLEYHVVKDIPFVPFTLIHQPHSLVGLSLVDLTKEEQKKRTIMQRAITDNAQNIAYGRYKAVEKGVDWDSVENNVAGGVVVCTNSVDAFQVLQENVIPGDAYQLLEIAQNNVERITGLSRANQGLDENVLKGDNAAATVIAALRAGDKRVLDYARNIADSWKLVIAKAYQFLRESDSDVYDVNVGFDTVSLTPSEFPENVKLSVNRTLGNDEDTQEAQLLISYRQLLMEDEQLAKAFGPEERFHLTQDIGKALGLPNAHLYLQNPNDIPVTDEEIYAQQVQQRQAELAMQEVASRVQVNTSTAQAKMLEVNVKAQGNQLEQVKVAQEGQIAAEELDIKRQQLAIDMAKVDTERMNVVQNGQAKATELGLRQSELRHTASVDAAKMLQEIHNAPLEASLEVTQARPVKLGN